MVVHGVKAYYPTIRTTKTIKGQSVTIEESWGAWRDSWDSSVWRSTLRGCSR